MTKESTVKQAGEEKVLVGQLDDQVYDLFPNKVEKKEDKDEGMMTISHQRNCVCLMYLV